MRPEAWVWASFWHEVLCPTTRARLESVATEWAASSRTLQVKGGAVPGEHTLCMIVECNVENLVCLFFQPFAMAGGVDADPA